MCTAYDLDQWIGITPRHISRQALADLLADQAKRIVRPTHIAPVIMPDGSLRHMSWGFRREFAPAKKGGAPIKRTIVNSREDKLSTLTWRKAFLENRCLVPAAAFYEWVDVEGAKVPLRFQRLGGEVIWIAGIWENSEEHGECYSMITTEPNGVLSPVHDRMPAVLTDEQITPYLEGELNEFGPSVVELAYTAAENFLKKDKPKPAPPAATQGELF
jgi:putative SOS response-associated peptidase YedK